MNVLYVGTPTWGWSKGLWPHKGTVSTKTWAGKTFKYYQVSKSARTTGPKIGTFVHENGHMLCGFPDLYPTATGFTTNVVGNFSVMSSASASYPSNPPPYDPYLRIGSGWLTPTDITDLPNTTQSLIANDPASVCLFTDTNSTGEEFLIEAVEKNGVNTNMPGEGILIWHIDESGSNTDNTGTFLEYVVQADGRSDLLNGTNKGGRSDFFCADSNRTSFSDNTSPSANWDNGSSSYIDINSVSAIGSTMTFNRGTGGSVVAVAQKNSIARGNEDITCSKGKLELSVPQTGIWKLSIFSPDGRLVSIRSLGLNAGYAVIPENLANGVYIAKLTGCGTSLVGRFLSR